jgi:hypothetical protein
VLRKLGVAGLSLLSFLLLGASARAEMTLAKGGDGWEVYSTGRLGVFVEALKGDGVPVVYGPTFDASGMPVVDPVTGAPVLVQIHPAGDGGISVQSDPVRQPDATCGGNPPCYRQGPVFASRVRSGFLGNILAFGVRRHLTEWTTLTGHIAVWGTTETVERRTYVPNWPDMREAYVRVDGPGGTLTAGRALSLFSRGAIEINYMYGHAYAVGNPAGFDSQGPSAGHIGYGVLAPVFVAGVSYATPKFHGLQLTAGYFDPAAFVGLYWTRTKFGRPEAEATYDAELGQIGKLHLFANGTWQRVYATDLPRHAEVYGVGGGGRIELGPFHLGFATHSGQGLGVYYALNGSDAVVAQYTTQELRKFAGYYAQAQLALGRFEINAGWGMTRVYSIESDINANWCVTATTPGPCAGFDPTTMQPLKSFLKSQMGYSGVLVYHVLPNLHLALDYFLSDVKWQQGEQQIVHSFNIGSTLVW